MNDLAAPGSPDKSSAPAAEVWHVLSAEDAMARLSATSAGLSATEAATRLARDGRNVLTDAAPVRPWRILLQQFSSFIIWVLLAAAVIAGFLGEWIDAGAIIGVVLINAGIGFTQEYRAENAIAALRRMAAPRARVRRDGVIKDVSAAEIVIGDVILLEAGDVIAADARLLRAASLTCVESALTGESLPAEKTEGVLDGRDLPLGDRANMVHMGTAVAAGSGEALVVAIGMKTEIGKIAGLINTTRSNETPLQQRLQALGRILVFVSLGIVGVLFVLGLLRGLPVMGLFLTSVSLAVAAVPEGLPAVVTVALALGVQRMARRRALIRRLPAVETLGSTTVICTDKTGTLTVNQMTVKIMNLAGTEYVVDGEGYAPVGTITRSNGTPPDAQLERALLIAGGCNVAQLSQDKDGLWKAIGDPTEGALLTLAAKGGWSAERIEREHPKAHEFPFDSDRKRMTVLRRGNGFLALVKGAPDLLLDRCTQLFTGDGVRLLEAAERASIADANADLANRALRVLGVAYRDASSDMQGHRADEIECDLIWVGLIGMQDPPRPEVKSAVEQCTAAGIRVVMITGDHPATALAIARQLGIAHADQKALSGAEIERMDDDGLRQAAPETPVYARVTAAHKLRIVRAWKANGAVVAMTGDGVNDAPAIKGADIGIAMGLSGTEVTKEASAMVITDDNFATIVAAVEEGRGVYDNIRKTIEYLLAGNAGELLLMAACIISGLPIPLLPVQLLWVNLVTDGLPALCLATDPIDRTLMTQPPRPTAKSMISRAVITRIGFTGLLTAATALGVFLYGLSYQNLITAQGNAFSVLVFAELMRSFGARSDTRFVFEMGLFSNLKLFIVVALSIVFQITSHQVAWLGDLMRTAPLPLSDCLVLLAFGCIPLAVLEIAKVPRRRQLARETKQKMEQKTAHEAK